MPNLRNISVKVRDFKCFEDWQGFDTILPINLIIGRNNAGKSALLDIIQQIAPQRPKWCDATFHRNGKPCVRQVGLRITDAMIAQARLDHVHDRTLGMTLREYAERCLGFQVIRTDEWPNLNSGLHLSNEKGADDKSPPSVHFCRAIIAQFPFPLDSISVLRLRADRDMRPDKHGQECAIGENGDNATRIVEWYLNDASGFREIVERQLVPDLNTILSPDWHVERIVPKRAKGDIWELYLEDASNNLVSLSHTGSGMKTLLLVLVNLLLLPHVQGKGLGEYVFCFEELENNLHPAVQRRLFDFLARKVAESGCTLFMSTHSHAVIDMFSRNKDAQLLHVKHNEGVAKVEVASTYVRKCKVLLDLDVRASDLLQANAVVWVEGSSDRIYFNRWIDLWFDGKLKEGLHYQCMWYGGTLLADMTYEEPEESQESDDGWDPEVLVNALHVNRNAIVLMDSDRREADSPLKGRVERVRKELDGKDGLAWVTAGREVENYIPPGVMQHAIRSAANKAPAKFADVLEFLGYKGTKPQLAQLVTPHMRKEMLSAVYDLEEMLECVCKKLKQWNGMQ
jgi:putative ATP-dependent endonuclease of OLD family